MKCEIPNRKYKSKAEAEWALNLKAQEQRDSIRWHGHECMKLKLGEGAWYTPDFIVIDYRGELLAHEIKGGFIREAAMVRFKVAKEKYPWIRFEMWQCKNKTWKQIK